MMHQNFCTRFVIFYWSLHIWKPFFIAPLTLVRDSSFVVLSPSSNLQPVYFLSTSLFSSLFKRSLLWNRFPIILLLLLLLQNQNILIKIMHINLEKNCTSKQRQTAQTQKTTNSKKPTRVTRASINNVPTVSDPRFRERVCRFQAAPSPVSSRYLTGFRDVRSMLLYVVLRRAEGSHKW